MASQINDFLQRISDKRPSYLLNPKVANNLYQFVPTEADSYQGLKLMPTMTSPTPYVKYTARQPVRGLMRAIVPGTRAPVSQKVGSTTERHVTVKFKDSHMFNEDELQKIVQAELTSASDAEIQECARMIATNIGNLKMKLEYTKEKLFWEGCWQGRMDVNQVDNGVESEYQISTGVRTVTALTSTATWNYWYTTSVANSTADPIKDIRYLDTTYTGKGGRLKCVYMNKNTYFMMLGVPKLRNEYQYTTVKLAEVKLDGPIEIAGYTIYVYDGGYLDDNGTFQNFIPNGYIIGYGEGMGMDAEPVAYVNCVNVDANFEVRMNSEDVKYVYGTYFRIKDVDDPVSKQFFISHNGLPVFRNPQLIVVQQVF